MVLHCISTVDDPQQVAASEEEPPGQKGHISRYDKQFKDHFCFAMIGMVWTVVVALTDKKSGPRGNLQNQQAGKTLERNNPSGRSS